MSLDSQGNPFSRLPQTYDQVLSKGASVYFRELGDLLYSLHQVFTPLSSIW